MTISSLAKALHTSKPTIYARIKKAGLNLSEIRDPLTQELTAEAVKRIAALFDDNTPALLPEKRQDPEHQLAIANERIQGLERETAALRELVNAKDAEIARLVGELEFLRSTLPALLNPPRRSIIDKVKDLFTKHEKGL